MVLRDCGTRDWPAVVATASGDGGQGADSARRSRPPRRAGAVASSPETSRGCFRRRPPQPIPSRLFLPPSSLGSLPAAQPAPKPRVLPPTPPPPPAVMPPMPVDVAGPVAVNIEIDPFDADHGTQASAELTAFLRSKRRVRQQQMTVILLLVAIVGLAVAGLLLAIGGSSGSRQNESATTEAKKARTAQPEAESPKPSKHRKGLNRSMPSRSRARAAALSRRRSVPPRQASLKRPTPRRRRQAGKRSATAASEMPRLPSLAAQEATPKKKPRDPQPGTPEGDFGLPEVDPSIP